MRLLTEESAHALIFGADLAISQNKKWFIHRGNAVRFTFADLLPAPEPFNLARLYTFTHKHKEVVHVMTSSLGGKPVVFQES